MIRLLLVSLIFTLNACSALPTSSIQSTPVTLSASELAFSKSMQDRDFKAFSAFIADDAVFINAGSPLRGKAAILSHWRKFFDSPSPPFSWRPVIAEVIVSDGLGYTEGPVLAPDSTEIAKFYSVWKLQPDGDWKVVFDNGYDICNCKQ